MCEIFALGPILNLSQILIFYTIRRLGYTETYKLNK